MGFVRRFVGAGALDAAAIAASLHDHDWGRAAYVRERDRRLVETA